MYPPPWVNLALQKIMTAMNRGWGERDFISPMLLQEEHAGGIDAGFPDAVLDEEAKKTIK